MHVAWLALCLFFCSDLRPASSQKPRIDSIDQSELVRKTVISGNIVKFAKRFLSLQKLAT